MPKGRSSRSRGPQSASSAPPFRRRTHSLQPSKDAPFVCHIGMLVFCHLGSRRRSRLPSSQVPRQANNGSSQDNTNVPRFCREVSCPVLSSICLTNTLSSALCLPTCSRRRDIRLRARALTYREQARTADSTSHEMGLQQSAI